MDRALVLAVPPATRGSTSILSRPPIRPIQCPEQCGVKIVDGVVLFWLLGEWQSLSNELWAWKLVTAWAAGHDHHSCSIWVPNLLLFDFWEYRYRQNESSILAVSTSVNEPQPVPSVITIIASRLFGILHRSGESELYRTCRLVCQDWANKYPVRERKDCGWRVDNGVVLRWVETEWWVLPSHVWAWIFVEPFSDEWWVEKNCRRQWFPKILKPIDSVQRNSRRSSTLPPPPSLAGAFMRCGAVLPTELFKCICDAADGESWSLRLVCRYWNRLCTPRVFERIDVERSPERIRALWKHRTDPIMQHIKSVEDVPAYTNDSKFPWVRLLTQACTSTQSVWKSETEPGTISILGPLRDAGGHRIWIRSVHFALPRSLPHSLSRGIKALHLREVRFRRLADLASLICELPDLEGLDCSRSYFNLWPIELPRRRPRTNRNKLSKVKMTRFMGDTYTFAVLTLYLSVYDAPSFFSEGEIAVIIALLHISLPVEPAVVYYEDDPRGHSRRLDFKTARSINEPDHTFLGLHILRDPARNTTTLLLLVDCRGRKADDDNNCWVRLDTEISNLTTEGLIYEVACVFGFADRDQMVHFTTDILDTKLSSISRHATIQYCVHVDGGDDDIFHLGLWRRASLDSEELTGTAKKELAEVYSQ